MQRVVVIGASAGGLDAIAEISAALPEEFRAPILVAMHVAPESPGVIPDILSRNGSLPASHPENGERLEPGRIYVAPPDHHLLVEPNRARLSKGPRENRFRPAIDPLFRSAAQVYGPGAIGVILTGLLDDGAAGLWLVKRMGGIAIVQDPADAMYPSMPRSALAYGSPDYRVPLAAIPELLVRLTTVEVGATVEPPAQLDVEVRIAREEDPMAAGVENLGEPSSIACPECHGVLREVNENGHVRFRCHTGHAFAPQSLLAEINQGIEVTIWNSIRAVQEGAILLRQFARNGRARDAAAAEALVQRADELERQANVMRDLLTIPAPD